MLQIKTAADDRDLFAQWREDRDFALPDCALYGRFSQHFHPVAYQDSHQDVSFAVLDGQRPVLLTAATIAGQRLDYYGLPLRLFVRRDAPAAERETAIDAAFAHLDQLAETRQVTDILLADHDSAGILSPIGACALNRHFQPALRLTAWADLGEGEAGLRKGLRKSYKSMLNWGKSNLEIRIVDGGNPDYALFQRYQAFHQEVAGRVTRPQKDWDAIYSFLAASQGELVLGLLPGDELVAGTVVADAGSSSYYLSGVYDRARFDKPMAHWPLWLALLRAGERGRKRFELGEVPLDGAASAKEVSIGFFKRGFATEISTWLAWRRTAPEVA